MKRIMKVVLLIGVIFATAFTQTVNVIKQDDKKADQKSTPTQTTEPKKSDVKDADKKPAVASTTRKRPGGKKIDWYRQYRILAAQSHRDHLNTQEKYDAVAGELTKLKEAVNNNTTVTGNLLTSFNNFKTTATSTFAAFDSRLITIGAQTGYTYNFVWYVVLTIEIIVGILVFALLWYLGFMFFGYVSEKLADSRRARERRTTIAGEPSTA